MHNKPHTAEAKAKQRAAKLGKKRGPHSAEHKAKIASAHLGKKKPLIFSGTCPCGKVFLSGANNAVFCSRKCNRASHDHGRLHAPQYAHFEKSCAICYATSQLVGDHDHKTDQPRGILCRNCNLALGNMFDDPQRMRRAADYIEENL